MIEAEPLDFYEYTHSTHTEAPTSAEAEGETACPTLKVAAHT
jgi:hypothetical protein